jgi:hypothetical protein
MVAFLVLNDFEAKREEATAIGRKKGKMPQVEFNSKAIKEIKKRKKRSKRRKGR